MKLKVSWWITFFGLFLFVSKSQSQNFPGAWGTEKKTYIDIDTPHNDLLDDEGSGKHSSSDTTTDDEDLLEGGSGEGSGSGDTEKDRYTTKAPTTKKMTACEQLRSSTKGFNSGSYYIPKCTSTGEYEKQQCEGKPGSKKCWCVNIGGVEIPGTQMIQPHMPDCQNGTNLKRCVFELVKSKQLLGAFIPRCTIDGDYEKIQCHEGHCWCVDEKGVPRSDRMKLTADTVLTCEEPKEKTTMGPPVRTFAPETPYPLPPETSKPPHHKHKEDKDKHPFDKDDSEEGYDVEETPDINVNIKGGKFDTEEDNNENDKSVQAPNKPEAQSTFLSMIESPGILAAVIGGSVVGLLCAILLVMFIVYRMRKKDEGSYPLEEQKYTNYSYMKAPDKEFYA